MITQPIVVGVDGSPESAAAASVGWRFARAAGVSCRLAHAAQLLDKSGIARQVSSQHKRVNKQAD